MEPWAGGFRDGHVTPVHTASEDTVAGEVSENPTAHRCTGRQKRSSGSLLNVTLTTHAWQVRSAEYVNGVASSWPASHVVTLRHSVCPGRLVSVGASLPGSCKMPAHERTAPALSYTAKKRPSTLLAPSSDSVRSGIGPPSDSEASEPKRALRFPHRGKADELPQLKRCVDVGVRLEHGKLKTPHSRLLDNELAPTVANVIVLLKFCENVTVTLFVKVATADKDVIHDVHGVAYGSLSSSAKPEAQSKH
mmetsp:Transcript_31070/g.81367  ORF Transcript_31070/g.81367 Transcript_31070/m.81367 type:complete len:249 (+) Transcript_31070:2125-2871(+)